MVFLNLTLKEIKLQFRSVTFYVFIIVVLLFYSYQYTEETNRLRPPKSDIVYDKVEVTTKEEKLVLGYKELYGVLKSRDVVKYAPIAKKIRLTDNQIKKLEKFIENMAPNADVMTIEPNDIKIDYETMINFMNNLDIELGGNTILGSKCRQFIRPMTYEEALMDYERQKSDKNITEVYGRILADYLGVSAGLFVVFLSAFSILRDKYYGTQELIYSSSVKAIEYIGAKFTGLFISVMSVFLTIGLIETAIFLFQANKYHIAINAFAFIKYIVIWVAPTVMFVIILPMLISIIVENSILPIVVQLGATLLLLLNTELTGMYDFKRFIIRFNSSKSVDYYKKLVVNIKYNRLFYMVVSILLILITAFIWTVKRNKKMGGIQNGN